MSDGTENLVLEHLRAIRSGVDDLKRDVNNLKHGQVVLNRLVSALVDAQATNEARFAEIDTRLDRIEKRLELVDV